ncbi:decarboxylating 6-phosphogluconate dehydrogenase [Mycoplasma iguanae]|uniref:Decarboxylating 6-phosphogluconate dehydrogenase n=1 Tax=Mycoplasma iguanae TaxID=292461 RepID=A0ABY5RAK3_9MOLU|nr:decarboxylating 6-phosphogluconate dehydrogenase [Mycoplasma iguanae]UVD81645.1 decarboxylating 6-phosphogluconate dehydrogenase [Mycoplasma iguanae]
MTKIGIIGLGKMGSGFALNAVDKGYSVIGYDPNITENDLLKNKIKLVSDIAQLVKEVGEQSTYLLSIPHGKPTEETIIELLKYLSPEAIIIDTGNNNWKNTKKNLELCNAKNVFLLDAGTSGGPSGARNGACFMVGGENEAIKKVNQLFKDLAQKDGFLHAGKTGSGHFLKMVHNGIEYGMMQAIAEGFAILDKSEFDFDLEKVAHLWNAGSVIRSWLIELTAEVFRKENKADFEATGGFVNATGEAKWTVESALELDVPAPVIALSLMLRQQSFTNDPFANKLLAQLRKQFGGHTIIKK